MTFRLTAFATMVMWLLLDSTQIARSEMSKLASVSTGPDFTGRMTTPYEAASVHTPPATMHAYSPGSLHEFTQGDGGEEQTDEQRLLYFLLRNYEKAVRPVRNASKAVTIKLGMTLTNIFDMDEKNQVLTTNVWLDQEWNDELLRWDPKDFNGIESIRMPCDLICADDYTEGYMRSRAMVFKDGAVFWPPPTKLRSTCKISVTFFPFDSQHCFLKFGSWTYHGYQVDVTNRSLNVDLSNYVESGEFELVSVYQKRRVVKYTCCEEPYPDLTFYIHLRRKTLYYFYNIVLPCFMMSILTLLVFCLPPDSGEKIALGITVLLAFSVFVLAIAEMMPGMRTSDSIPLIGIYLTSVMAMTSISVVMTVMVLNFHHRGPFNRPVPPWVHKYVLGRVRQGLRMRMPYAGFVNSIRPGIASIGNAMLQGMNINSQITENLLRNQNISTHTKWACDDQPKRVESGFSSRKVIGFAHQAGSESVPLIRHSNATEFDAANDTASGDKRSRRRRGTEDALQEKLLKTLEMLTTRQQSDDRLQLMANEWRQVAQIVDRLLFWLFLFATTILTSVLLIIVPFYHRYTDEPNFDDPLHASASG